MDLRFATEADTDRLVALINAAFAVEKFFKVGERTDAAEITAYLGQGRFMVLEDEAGLAGCVYVEIRPAAASASGFADTSGTMADAAPPRGYFGMLSVDPGRQRSGIGGRLIAAAEEFCRERGCHFMDISIVNLRTELPPLYARFGYQVTGQAPFPMDQMPVKTPCSFILMSKELGHRP